MKILENLSNVFSLEISFMWKTSLHFLFNGSFWIHIDVGFYLTLVLVVGYVGVTI